MTNAAQSGRFRIGGKFEVNRLGFGAMRIVGKGIWGPPADRAEAIRTLKRLPDLGVDFIDTADSDGPDFSEELIREALHPYGPIKIATKGGLARTGPNVWIPLGRPEYLIQQAHKSRWRLGVETIDLWQLHRIDPKVPRGRAVRRDQDADRATASSARRASRRSASPISRRRRNTSRSRRCRTATISPTARARPSLDYCAGRGSASFRGFRSTPATSPARAARSTRSRSGARRARARSRSPGS